MSFFLLRRETPVREDAASHKFDGLTLVFLLTPLWWLLGFNIFISHLTVFFLFIKLLIRASKKQDCLRVPRPVLWFFLFMISYGLSILINAGNYPAQRIFASLNNYLTYLMGGGLILLVNHADLRRFLLLFAKAAQILCYISGVIALVFLASWFSGHSNVNFPSLMGRIFPRLTDYPFFSIFLTISVQSTEFMAGNLPRLAIYSTVHTATGGFMLLILPIALAQASIQGSKINLFWILAAGLGTLLFSFSRAAICAFLGAFVFVKVFGRKRPFFTAMVCLGIMLAASRYLYDLVFWVLNYRSSSTVGRMILYEDAIRIVMEQNPLMGIGVRLREGFSSMIVGSHSTYISLLLVSGILGVTLFTVFQAAVFIVWIRQKPRLKTREQKVMWSNLGMGYLGATLWFATDALDALPFAAYCYFLIIGCILSSEKLLTQVQVEIPDGRF